MDGFRCALNLWKTQKNAFEALATYPVPFKYDAPGKAFFDVKTTIEVDKHADKLFRVRRRFMSF